MCKSGGTFELADEWIKGAVCVLRRAEIAQSCVRFMSKAFQKSSRQARFANPGLTGQQDNLTLAALSPRPAP